MMTIEKIEAMVNAMTKYIVLAIIVLAAMTVVRCDAFAATAIETTEETEETGYTEETYAILDENHAVEVYCEFDEGWTWVYTYEFDSVADYENDNYRMVAVKAIDMGSCEIVTDWASPWNN